jgi:hypothetical protein
MSKMIVRYYIRKENGRKEYIDAYLWDSKDHEHLEWKKEEKDGG